jgi:hypothetical protein
MNELDFAILVISLAVILSVLHYFSHKISKFMEMHHYRVLSFSGGTLIAFIFLVLLPEVIHVSASTTIFLLILLGFLIFFLTEKFLYQNVKNKKELLKELKTVHIIGFFADHFIMGFLLVTTLELTMGAGFLILIPIFLNTISSSIAMVHIHEKAETNVNKFILSASPILGAIFALLLETDESVQAMILAFILGMLLFIVNRDVLPKEEKGDPLWFIIGIIIIISILLIINSAGI